MFVFGDRDAFIIEYIGEVIERDEFNKRADAYRSQGIRHYYFMTIGPDAIIDATRKGNVSRFINHSCAPNCITQKWTVGGKTRVGLFALRDIASGEELTFDYKFVRFG